VPLVPGTDVVDTLFGAAKVLRETKRGYLIALEPSGIKVDRPRDALVLPDGSPLSEVVPVPLVVERDSRPDDSAFHARMAMEALRFGVVPATHLANLTLGHDELVAWVTGQLPRPGEAARAAAVYGPFGSGKSHMMAAVREVARQHGYLAMATEIDGTEISLAQPRELLASLLDHLIGSTDLDGAAPLLGLVSSAIASGVRSAATSRARLLAENVSTVQSLKTTRRFDDLEDILERLLGSDPALSRTDFKGVVRDTLDWDDYVRMTYDSGYSPRPLISHSPVDQRPYDFAHALIGYASLARNAGFEGLVVTIDELEVEDALYSPTKWAKVRSFVAAMQEELGAGQPIVGGLAIFFAAVGEGTAVEDQIVDLVVDSTGGQRYELKPWHRSDLMDLSRRIHELYTAAYGLEIEYDGRIATNAFELIDGLDLEQSGEVRAFIRAYIARLDVVHGPPAA
jgi:hypothetical protein